MERPTLRFQRLSTRGQRLPGDRSPRRAPLPLPTHGGRAGPGGNEWEKGTAAVFSSWSGQGSDGAGTGPVSTGQKAAQKPAVSTGSPWLDSPSLDVLLSTSCMPSIPEGVQGVGSVVSSPRGPSVAAGGGAGRTESRRRERRVRGGGLTARRVDTQASPALGPLPTCPLVARRGACPPPGWDVQSRTQQPPSKPASSPNRRPLSTSSLQPGEILRLPPAHSP